MEPVELAGGTPRPRAELEQFFGPPRLQEGEAFGAAVAIARDQLVVVAASEDILDADGAKREAGAAHAFERTAEGWQARQHVPREGPASGDGLLGWLDGEAGAPLYAYSIAFTGPELIIGTAMDDRGAEADSAPVQDSGAVQVYLQEGDSYTFQQTLKAPVPEREDHFGYRAAVSGPWLAVTAPSEDSSPTGGLLDNSREDSGAVFMFLRVESGWQYSSMVKAPNADPGDRFGSSVALQDDLLVVGAMYESSKGPRHPMDNSIDRSGAVYLFRLGDDRGWRLSKYLKADDPRAYDGLGMSVALSNDAIAAGGWAEGRATDTEAATAESGGVVMTYRNDAALGWIPERIIRAKDPTALFGASVALDGAALWVGAPGEVYNNVRSGAAHVHHRGRGDWQWHRTVVPRNVRAGDLFGTWLSASDDRVAIGAPGKRGSATDAAPDGVERAGAAYVYRF